MVCAQVVQVVRSVVVHMYDQTLCNLALKGPAIFIHPSQ